MIEETNTANTPLSNVHCVVVGGQSLRGLSFDLFVVDPLSGANVTTDDLALRYELMGCRAVVIK